MQVFEKIGDYEAFERTLCEPSHVMPMRIYAYCVLPNHWHFLLWPEHDSDLAKFMQRLTITHVRRWQEHRHYVGLGPRSGYFNRLLDLCWEDGLAFGLLDYENIDSPPSNWEQ
jgi:REP element-mobilizing transposase RayT